MSALRQQVTVFIDQNLSPQARARALAAAAKKGLADLQASRKAGKDYRRFVDGRLGAAEESVKPGGVILYEFSYIGDAAEFALAFLRGRSPVESGRYRDSFYVGVDGRFLRARDFRPSAVPPGAEIVIGNTTPYSRKVDVQLVGGKRLRFSVPPNLFDDCAREVRREFGGTVKAKRVYTMDFPGRYALRQTTMRKDAPHRVARHAGDKVESPALILNPVG